MNIFNGTNYFFGPTSLKQLETLHPVLKGVAKTALAISPIDFRIVEGFRNEERQNEMVRRGWSKVRYPNSKHNAQPSRAFDFFPLPKDKNNKLMEPNRIWREKTVWNIMAGVFFSAANIEDIHSEGFRLRWGGDWNTNWTSADQSFNDLGHIELIEL